MKTQVSKYWLWATLAINLVSISFNDLKAQQGINHKVYYQLLNDIVLKDRIVSKLIDKRIAQRVRDGKMSKVDCVRYYDIVSKKPLFLYRKKSDSIFKEVLDENQKVRTFLREYVSRKEIEEALENIPKQDDFHNLSLISEKIDLLGEITLGKPYHEFSSPIRIGKNRYSVLHFRASEGYNNFEQEIIIYSEDVLENRDYIIIDRFVFGGHGMIPYD